MGNTDRWLGVAAAGDAFGCDSLDEAFVDVPVVIDEGSTRRQIERDGQSDEKKDQRESAREHEDRDLSRRIHPRGSYEFGTATVEVPRI